MTSCLHLPPKEKNKKKCLHTKRLHDALFGLTSLLVPLVAESFIAAAVSLSLKALLRQVPSLDPCSCLPPSPACHHPLQWVALSSPLHYFSLIFLNYFTRIFFVHFLCILFHIESVFLPYSCCNIRVRSSCPPHVFFSCSTSIFLVNSSYTLSTFLSLVYITYPSCIPRMLIL